jgi:hypothetical protein
MERRRGGYEDVMKIAMADGFGAGAGVVRGSGGPRLCRGRRRAPQPHEGLGRVGNGLSPPSQRGSWLPRGRAGVHIISLAPEERRSGGRCVLRVYSVYCRACLPLYAALSCAYLITAGGLAARGLLDCPVRLGRAMEPRGTRRYMYNSTEATISRAAALPCLCCRPLLLGVYSTT